MEPDIHFCASIELACIAQFLSQFLTVVQAGVDTDQFHEVDNRSPPIQVLALGHGRQIAFDIHFGNFRGSCLLRLYARTRTRRDISSSRRLGCSFRLAKDSVLDFSENAHEILLVSPKRMLRDPFVGKGVTPRCVFVEIP